MGEKDYFLLVSQASKLSPRLFCLSSSNPIGNNRSKISASTTWVMTTASSKSSRKPNNFKSFLSHSRYRRHLLACLQNKRWNSLDDDDFFFSVVHHLSARCDFFSHILLLSVVDGLFIVFLSLVGQIFQDLEAETFRLGFARQL